MVLLKVLQCHFSIVIFSIISNRLIHQRRSRIGMRLRIRLGSKVMVRLSSLRREVD